MGVDRLAAGKLGSVRARPARSLSSVTGVAVSIAVLSAVSCERSARPPQPSIAITEIPPPLRAARGHGCIAGRVDGVRTGAGRRPLCQERRLGTFSHFAKSR